jgi:uncharacterized peroxidase-related enzyme
VTFVEPVPEEEAEGPLAELYAADRARAGYLPNYSRAFSHNPDAYAAWKQLSASIAGAMDTRRYELATIGAARALRSSYCLLAHGKILVGGILSAEAVAELADSGVPEELTEQEAAVVAYAEQIARDATAVTAADVDRLREVGLDDAEITNVALAATARCFFSKTLDALGALPDAAYAELDEELRTALVRGRPIDGS